jgi:hypothetical protein
MRAGFADNARALALEGLAQLIAPPQVPAEPRPKERPHRRKPAQ